MFRVLSLLVLFGRGVPIRLTDVGSVAGRWAGFSDPQGDFNGDTYVELTLRGDGTYETTSPRTVRLMDARGQVQLNCGRLVIEGRHGASGTASDAVTVGDAWVRASLGASSIGVRAVSRPATSRGRRWNDG